MSNHRHILSALFRWPIRQFRQLTDDWLVQNCALCAAESGSVALCASCCADLQQLPEPSCRRCALPLTGTRDTAPLCGNCLRTPPHYDNTFALYRYSFPVDTLIQMMKYGFRLELAVFFAKQMLQLSEQSRLQTSGADLIVPLPLSRLRLRERGFNQALEIARPLAKQLGLPLDGQILQRIRHDPPQAGLPLQQRRKNIRGSFACRTALAGQTIILIDDVMTSGSTLDEASRTLKQSGARRIIAVVLARAERDHYMI